MDTPTRTDPTPPPRIGRSRSSRGPASTARTPSADARADRASPTRAKADRATSEDARDHRATSEDARDHAGRARRQPRPLSRARLERIALQHLERHPCSAARLRRVLDRRAARSRAEHGGDPAEHAEWIESVIARLLDLGRLDDHAYAAAVARSLRLRGGSRRLIAARLAERGVPGDVRQSVLEQESAEEPDAERRAAAAYARRRGLGPHRPDAERAARRERDLAALARAGFSYDTASDVLDEPSD